MSSNTDDTNLLAQNNNLIYNSFDWKPITFTHVEYPKGDLFGQLLAWISLAPMGIGAGFVTLILFRRDLHTIAFFIGTLVNEVSNIILKHWIREPRPINRVHIGTEFGMPSSHSQFIWFFSTYVTLFIFIRLHHINNNTLLPLERAGRLLVLVSCWCLTALVCLSRTYLQYHTWNQVIVGSLIGIITGLLWFTLTHLILTPLFPTIVSWKLSEYLLLRDTTLIPNILWFEYTVTRQEARARTRKLIKK
ncbi:dolichyldiphosphatase 1-like [Contarinia nasturtii]|uniref:dolichyldiphosphatase 1-like n=1 Tax=Contarinia nasturtii TaxID=265458 RepID=UPI0012D462BA|nr:dolichyldiphosphatase 1-like [Contarinia nasturtii]